MNGSDAGTAKEVSPDELKRVVRNIPDFPKPGIQFKDITPVLADGRLLAGLIHLLARPFQPGDIDVVVGIDARGFILASAVAIHLEAGFVPIRKQGKLPFDTHEESYDLEYGSNTMAIHTDAIRKGSQVLIVDDLLATGGTAAAAANLVRKLGGDIREVSFFVELTFLNGRERLGNLPLRSLVTF